MKMPKNIRAFCTSIVFKAIFIISVLAVGILLSIVDVNTDDISKHTGKVNSRFMGEKNQINCCVHALVLFQDVSN